MNLTQAYLAKSAALKYLQTVSQYKDQEKIKTARKVYATACKKYEEILAKDSECIS